MSEHLFEDVKDFHEKMNIPIRDTPQLPPEEELTLRLNLILEEFQETLEACKAGDLVELADGLIDLAYITIGGLLVAGMPAQKLWDEVHKTNMAKIPAQGENPGETKIAKPVDWEPPKIREILEAAGAELG